MTTTNPPDRVATFPIGHVGVNVADLDRSKAFYATALGFDVTAEGTEDGRRFAFLSREGQPVVTLWQQSDGRFDAHQPGLHHLAFRVGSIADVEAAQARLVTLGAEFIHAGVVAHSEGSQSGGIFFTDPDGIRLEIYAPSGAHDHDAPTGTAPTCGFF